MYEAGDRILPPPLGTSKNSLTFGIFDAPTINFDCSKFKTLIDQLLCYSQVFFFTLIEVVLHLLYSNLMNDFEVRDARLLKGGGRILSPASYGYRLPILSLRL